MFFLCIDDIDSVNKWFYRTKKLENEIYIKFLNIIETFQKVHFWEKDLPVWLWQKTTTSSVIYANYTF